MFVLVLVTVSTALDPLGLATALDQHAFRRSSPLRLEKSVGQGNYSVDQLLPSEFEAKHESFWRVQVDDVLELLTELAREQRAPDVLARIQASFDAEELRRRADSETGNGAEVIDAYTDGVTRHVVARERVMHERRREVLNVLAGYQDAVFADGGLEIPGKTQVVGLSGNSFENLRTATASTASSSHTAAASTTDDQTENKSEWFVEERKLRSDEPQPHIYVWENNGRSDTFAVPTVLHRD